MRSMRARAIASGCAALTLGAGAAGLFAQDPASAPPAPSPYAGLESRPVKALSAERRAGLLAGTGLGYGLAAELNGHAGPKHVLELAEELALTPEQSVAANESFERMRTA
ncbi:MAG TPA: hypothetical protein VGC00_11440, partial [Thermoanaerobaculia bacterium]